MIAQKGGTLKFEISGSLLHFLFQFAQKLSQIEIAARFADNRGLDFASAKNRVQTFLHGAPDGLRGDSVFFIVIHLLFAPIFRNRNECLHALRDCVREKYDFSINVARGPTCGLDQRSLASQEAFLVRIQNADERNLGKIKPFAEQIDSDENVEICSA